MRIGGGIERWMVLLPVFGLVVLITVYVGGPDAAIDSLERAVDDAWHHVVLLFRR